MKLKNKLIRIFEENGIDPSDNQQLMDIDSIQYISIIVEIEQCFGIVLPDYLLSENKFIDFDGFAFIVQNVYEESYKNAMLPTENIIDTNLTNIINEEDL